MTRTVGFRLMLITDWGLGREVLLTRLSSILGGVPHGLVAIQHRHVGVSARQFLDEAKVLASVCADGGAPLFINARLDVAAAVEGHLHLPAHGVSVDDARAFLPPGRLISHAVHRPEEIQAGADLALVSPVFTPRSKPDDTRQPLGVEGFNALAQRLWPCPAFALGGIDALTAKTLQQASGFATINGVTTPAEAAQIAD